MGLFKQHTILPAGTPQAAAATTAVAFKQHSVLPAGNSQAVAAANVTSVNTCVAQAIASAAASVNASNGERLLGFGVVAAAHQI